MVLNFSALTGKWGPVLRRSPGNQSSREGCKGPTFFPSSVPILREDYHLLASTPKPQALLQNLVAQGAAKSPSTRTAAITHLPAIQLNPSVPHLPLQQVLRDTCCWPQGATG